MRLTSFVVWKSWVSNPLRTALTVLGVALGVAVVIAIHVLDHNTIRSYLQEKRPDFGRVDLELIPRDRRPLPEVREDLEGREGIAHLGLLHEGSLLAQQAPVELFGLSPLPSRSFAHYQVQSGRDLSDLDGDGAVLIGEQLALDLGLQVGDKLLLKPRDRAPASICKDGKRTTKAAAGKPPEPVSVQVKGLLSSRALGRRNLGHVVVGSFSLARRLMPNGLTHYQVNRSPGTDPDRLRQELRPDYDVRDERSALIGERADERAFRNGIKVLGGLALVMGMLVVFQTLSQSLMERLKQIGLLRCLGTGRSGVAGIFLLDALLLAIFGVILGAVLGIGLAWLLAAMEFTTLGQGKTITDFEVPLRPLLIAGGLGLLFTLAGAAFPLFKARNLPPIRVLQSRGLGDEVNLLRGINVWLFFLLVLPLPFAYLSMTPLLQEEGQGAMWILLQLGGMVLLFGGVLLLSPGLVRLLGAILLKPIRKFLPLPAFLVQKALSRSPGRFAAAVCGLTVVLVAMVALKHITYGLRGEIQDFAVQAMDRQVFMQGAPQTAERLKFLQKIEGVEEVNLFYGSAKAPFVLHGLPLASLTRPGAPLAEQAEKAKAYQEQRCLVASKRWALLNGYQEGAKVLVHTDQGDRPYTLLAVSDAAGYFPEERAWAVADPRWLNHDYCVGAKSINKISLTIKHGTDLDAMRSTVQTVFPHSWYKTSWDVRDYELRDQFRDFLMFDLLLFLILVLVAVGLVNTMTIAAVGRAREIGVIRALGMDNKELRLTYLIEGAVVGVVASGMAIAMGLPLGRLVVQGMNQMAGLEAPVVIPWLYIAVVPVLALATGLLAAILPGLRAVRMNPAQSVRYE